MNEYVPRECLTFSPAYRELFVVSAELQSHTVLQVSSTDLDCPPVTHTCTSILMNEHLLWQCQELSIQPPDYIC